MLTQAVCGVYCRCIFEGRALIYASRLCIIRLYAQRQGDDGLLALLLARCPRCVEYDHAGADAKVDGRGKRRGDGRQRPPMRRCQVTSYPRASGFLAVLSVAEPWDARACCVCSRRSSIFIIRIFKSSSKDLFALIVVLVFIYICGHVKPSDSTNGIVTLGHTVP